MRILIIGCGRLGAGLARLLVLRGHTVTVVDKNPEAFERLGKEFKGKTVTGVGFDRDVLLKAGIERTDGLAAVTDKDEVNVVTARVARQFFRVPKVVAGLYEPARAEVYQRLGLQVIAPITWGVNRIADLLLQSEVNQVGTLGSADVKLVVTHVPHLLVGRPVRELTVQGEISVVAIARGGRSFLPTLGTVFRENDELHLAVLATSSGLLERLLSQAGE